MKSIARLVAVLGLVLGFCSFVSAGDTQPVQASMIAPTASCCIPPLCPPCGLPPQK